MGGQVPWPLSQLVEERLVLCQAHVLRQVCIERMLWFGQSKAPAATSALVAPGAMADQKWMQAALPFHPGEVPGN